MNKTYATESKAYDAEMTVRKAPLQTSLQELENALMKLGEVSQRYLTATESVRRMSPTVETERGDVDKPHHSSLTHQAKPKRGRPTEIKRDITKTSQSGLREGLTRATFIIREDTLDKLKERAYTDRKKLKDLVTEALDYYLDKTKTDGGDIDRYIGMVNTFTFSIDSAQAELEL